MNRRRVLTATAAAVAGGLAGCTAVQSGDDETDDPDSTPTETPSSEPSPADSPTETTPTPTREPFPDSCPEGPDVDGLPSVPESPTEENIAEFVTEFERVYAVATNDEYRALEDVRVTDTESTDGRFRVELAVEATMVTGTPGPDGETPTPRPAGASAHRALYRIQGEQVVRELRGHAAGRKISSECWTVDSG